MVGSGPRHLTTAVNVGTSAIGKSWVDGEVRLGRWEVRRGVVDRLPVIRLLCVAPKCKCPLLAGGLKPTTQHFAEGDNSNGGLYATLGRWTGKAFDRNGTRRNSSPNSGSRDLRQDSGSYRMLDKVDSTAS